MTAHLDYDVFVAGGGVAGWAAALAAARNGARTLLVERRSYLGGNLAAGLTILGFHNIEGQQIVHGIPQQLVDRLVAAGASPGHEINDQWSSSVVPVDPILAKTVMLDMALEAGADLLLYAQVIDAVKKDGALQGLVVQKKPGRETITSEVFIDATGDAHLSLLAGAPTQKGREADGEMQSPTLLFRLCNVDMPRLRAHLKDHPEDYVDWRMKPGKKVTPQMVERTSLFLILPQALQEAEARGDYVPRIDRVMFTTIPNSDDVLVNMLRGYEVDGTRSESITDAVIQLRRDLPKLVTFFRKYVPGFERAYAVEAEPDVLLRETRRIVGEYVLNRGDVLEGRRFGDSIALCGYYIDVHNPADPGSACVLSGTTYGIPYRSLLPQTVDGLLVAGRCISGTHEAAGSFRIMATCMATGEAAGTAAAMAAEKRVAPRALDTASLRRRLRAQGATVDWPEALV